MKKYLQFLKFAFKEPRQYKTNFFASMAAMVFNDACFIVIFLIFLWYFTNIWLTFWNFLIMFSISCVWYGVAHWLTHNISLLNDIIESWKFDYYLSFPIKPLKFLSFTKVSVIDLWDLVFWTICMLVYAFAFADGPVWLILLKALAIFILASIIVLWMYIAFWSISFWLQKWSKIQDMFNTMIASFSWYPPETYGRNKLVYVFLCILLFPWAILPYKMMIWTSTLSQWIILIWFTIVIPIIWVRIFKRGLKRYSSGNLVHQM